MTSSTECLQMEKWVTSMISYTQDKLKSARILLKLKNISQAREQYELAVDEWNDIFENGNLPESVRNKILAYNHDDYNPNQQLDWKDTNQRYCKKHKRNYHFTCRGCHP